MNHTWINLGPKVSLGSGFAVNGVYQSLQLPGYSKNGGFQIGDPDLILYNLSYHVLPTFWVTQTMNVFPGIGQFSKNDFINAGVGYSTFAPELAVTYLFDKFETSADGHMDFNTTNGQTHYHSGTSFNIDYNVGVSPLPALPALQFGINGYIQKQIEDDRQNGLLIGNGNRSQVFGLGPLVRYDIGQGGLLMKWQHELGVQNHTKGDRIWFQFAIPL